MNESLALMEKLESIGHDLVLEGDNLRIVQGKHLLPLYREQIIEHKPQLLSILKADAKAVQSQFMVGISGTIYMKSVSRFTTVYVERTGSQWEAWRETYQQGRTTASSYKTIVPPSSFGVAMAEAEKYFQYIERKRNS